MQTALAGQNVEAQRGWRWVTAGLVATVWLAEQDMKLFAKNKTKQKNITAIKLAW